MSLTIRDERTVAAIRRLAEMTHRSPEEAVRNAVEAETARAYEPLAASRVGTVSPEEIARRLTATKAIQDEVASWPKTGLRADKAFYDSLNDDDR